MKLLVYLYSLIACASAVTFSQANATASVTKSMPSSFVPEATLDPEAAAASAAAAAAADAAAAEAFGTSHHACSHVQGLFPCNEIHRFPFSRVHTV